VSASCHQRTAPLPVFATGRASLAVFPGVAITLAVLAFNFIGGDPRDAFDRRQRVRLASGLDPS